jgi:myosin heavy subunit
VPGGPAAKFKQEPDDTASPRSPLQIEKSDVVTAIDPDGKSGLKQVTANSLVQLLRGEDVVGSQVTLQILKNGSSRKHLICLRRADFRSVERIKELYLKFAELEAEAKVLTKKTSVEGLMKLLQELQAALEHQTDWAAKVEEHLRSHVSDLEELTRRETKRQTQRCADLEDKLARLHAELADTKRELHRTMSSLHDALASSKTTTQEVSRPSSGGRQLLDFSFQPRRRLTCYPPGATGRSKIKS